MKTHKVLLFGAMAAALAMAGCATTPDDANAKVYTKPATVNCKMSYSLSGWSALYKHAEGTGVVRCDNGQSAPVNIVVTGGGLTAGKWKVDNGSGTFSDVHDIDEVFGSYLQGSAHAGAVKSAEAQALTKGPVSLALAGTGQGVGLGVAIGKFTISRQ